MGLKLKDEESYLESQKEKDEETLEKGLNEMAEIPLIKTTDVGQYTKGYEMTDIIIKVIGIVLVAALLVGAYFLFFGKKETDLKEYVNYDTDAIEKKLNIKLTRNDETYRRVRQYSNGKVTTDGNGDLAVLYLDGKQFGIHVDSDKYSLYGMKIGDPLNKKVKGYDYETSYSVLNDIFNGQSTSYFYINETNNDCLELTYNDTSGRIVAMTYFNDYRRMSERLSFSDDE